MANTLVSVVTASPLGDSPVQVVCPECHQSVLSKVDYSSGLLTYLFCGGLFFCGHTRYYTEFEDVTLHFGKLHSLN
ncbi:lipopolysaccharide-induced tumor necrosis factor-alpha factor homolog [Perca flavescens]|uniref:lipopolysaccharide-induced tumor necrosis factor-alpha factor homolog n=1 Tax=Perca flavescens TaxID=8167 RepID=UPI00106E2787|nr:lipopolysaccharide-induced tumor necrosis factor-alpha factor homolog [Perca flavescens]